MFPCLVVPTFLASTTAAARVGIRLELLNLLAATDEFLTVDQLHQENGDAPVLLGKLAYRTDGLYSHTDALLRTSLKVFCVCWTD